MLCSSKKELHRNWLCYSESAGKLFCFSCKLLTTTQSLKDASALTSTGFNDWKNAQFFLSIHEQGFSHRDAISSFYLLTNKVARVDQKLMEQLEEETTYWEKVLDRIIEVIKFLAERGLPLRGTDEKLGSPHNGNYLGVLELLAKFDPFLQEHLKNHANRGKGSVSYLSKTICDEFIDMIAKNMLDHIIKEIKDAKYFSMSLDSTPDVAHTDQLCLIVRYVLDTGPVEKIIKFLESDGHSAESMCRPLLDFLKENNLNISDCRGQSYDNAYMSGKYNGLQAKIK